MKWYSTSVKTRIEDVKAVAENCAVIGTELTPAVVAYMLSISIKDARHMIHLSEGTHE